MKIHKNLIKLPQVHQIRLQYIRPFWDGMHHITSVTDAATLFRQCYAPQTMDVKEEFWVAYLTSNLRLLHIAQISVGGHRQVTVNIKEIVQLGLLVHAGVVMVCHNHPSGSLTISEWDKQTTKRLHSALQLFEINFLDHLILTSEGYSSFAEEGLL